MHVHIHLPIYLGLYKLDKFIHDMARNHIGSFVKQLVSGHEILICKKSSLIKRLSLCLQDYEAFYEAVENEELDAFLKCDSTQVNIE